MLVKTQHKIVVASLIGGMLATVVFLVNDPRLSVPEAAGVETIYTFDSNTNMEFTSDQAITANLVYQDNQSTQAFTMNVSSFDYDFTPGVHVSWLGANVYTNLTGTAPGQFVVGNPTLQSLGNATNLVNTKYLYGVRTYDPVVLTNYEHITVSFGWEAGGDDSGGYSGFLAYSMGSPEAWAPLGIVQRPIDPTTAGTLSFTDTNNNILIGSSVKFALIMGGSKSKAALKNLYFTVQGALRTTLNSISNAHFNHSGNYEEGETIALTDLLFDAIYSYRNGGNTVNLNGTSTGVTLTDDEEQPLPNPLVYATSGNRTILITYTDPNGFGVQSTALYFYVIDADSVLTGIYAKDLNKPGLDYYVYAFFDPNIAIYPLYDSAVTPGAYDLPFDENLYTLTTVNPKVSGDLLKTGFSLAYEYNDNTEFTSTLTYTVASREIDTEDPVTLTHPLITFEANESFSLGALVVTTHWSAGPDTVIPYAATPTDGYFTSSKTVGAILDSCGSFTNTITYLANSTDYTENYGYTVEYVVASMFQHYFTDSLTVFGATTGLQKGNFSQAEYTVDNAVSGADDVTYLYTKYSTDNNGDGAAYQLTEDGLVLGTGTMGPEYVTLMTKNLATININSVHYSGILKMRIDMATYAETQVTIMVAGILPYRYQVDAGEMIESGVATTADDGVMHSYIFYLPYVAIGQVTFHIQNHTTPEPMTIGFIAFAGYDLTLECRAKAFAQMLNYADACELLVYQNFLPVYNYLVSVEADGYLTGIMMNLHDETNTLDAQELWNYMVAIHGEQQGFGRKATQLETEALTNWLGFGFILIFFLIGIGYSKFNFFN